MKGRWIARKVVTATVTLLFVFVVNFFLFRVMGDPTAQLAHVPRATPEEIVKLRHFYGLDQSLVGQFGDYLVHTLQLDFGISYRTREPVFSMIWHAIPWTLLLVGLGTLLATPIGSWMGVRAAKRRGTRTDGSLLAFSLFTYAAPEYWVGIILILLFAVWVPMLPAGLQMTPGAQHTGFVDLATDVASHMVLPVTAMTLVLLGQYFMIMRSSMVDVLTEDYIVAKRATGLSWDRVVNRHAVPNALLPLVTISALQFGAVAGGAITIETIFSWPGLGMLSLQAIQYKDFPVLQGAFLVFSAGVIVANLAADLLYSVLDPRVSQA